jgi:hypothetical protein
MVIYPDSHFPSEVRLAAGQPTIVEAVLADGSHCGDRLQIPTLGVATPFSDDGYAELHLSPDRALTLTITCDDGGLTLAP